MLRVQQSQGHVKGTKILVIIGLQLLEGKLMISRKGYVKDKRARDVFTLRAFLASLLDDPSSNTVLLLVGTHDLPADLRGLKLENPLGSLTPLLLESLSTSDAEIYLDALLRQRKIVFSADVKTAIFQHLKSYSPTLIRRFVDCIITHVQKKSRRTATPDHVREVYKNDVAQYERDQALLCEPQSLSDEIDHFLTDDDLHGEADALNGNHPGLDAVAIGTAEQNQK